MSPGATEGPTPDLPLLGTSLVQHCMMPSVAITGWALAQLGCKVVRVRLSNVVPLAGPDPWQDGMRWLAVNLDEAASVADLLSEIDAEVLRMLGYDEATIAHLFEAGVVASPVPPW